VETTEDRVATEAEECRRIAELLRLDAVGVLRAGQGRRRVTWWAAPGSGPFPLDLSDVLEGRAEGWIAAERGGDLVFGRLGPDSSARSVSALRAILASRSGEDGFDQRAADAACEQDLESERARWAYAIHDGLTQVVTAAVLELEWLARRVEIRPEQAVTALGEAASELRAALLEIRRILAVLTPEQPGTETRESLERLVRGVAERWRIPTSWTFEGDIDSVPPSVLDAASSVIREGVANAAKHSASDEVAIRVQASNAGVEVRVEDRGRGFDPAERGAGGGHLGLEMMRRRVAEVRGTLDIESTPGRGTRVVARLPVDDQGETP